MCTDRSLPTLNFKMRELGSAPKQVLARNDGHSFATTGQCLLLITMKWNYEGGEATRGYRTLRGFRLRNVLIVLAIIVSLLALIIGLAVGLTLKNHNSMSPLLAQRTLLIVVKICHYQKTREGFFQAI